MAYVAKKFVPVVAYGQRIEGIEIPIGSSVEWDITCQDPSTRLSIPLTTGFNVSMGLCALDERGAPTYPPIFSHQATIVDANAGTCTLAWTYGDTVPTLNAPLPPGLYGVDLWLTDDQGNRLALLAFIVVRLLPAALLPGQAITPTPAQNPLGVGPPGLAWHVVFQAGAYNAAFLDMVVGDPTAASFNVALPSIASLPPNAQGAAIVIINDGGPASVNTVAAVPNGADRIRISGTTQAIYLVNQGEALRLQPIVKLGGNLWYAW